MRALLAFVLLALLPIMVVAQPAKPDFWPAPLSAHASRVLTETNTDGTCWGYVARRKADNAVMVHRWCGLRAQWPSNWFDEAARLLVGTEAERDAAWAKYTGSAGWDWRMNGPATTLLTRLQAPDLVPPPWPGDAPPQPPPPLAEVWTVQPNLQAADGSRPVYAVINGARQTTALSGVRAVAGSACDCSVRFTTSASTFCAVNGRTDQVAACVRK